MNKATNVHRPLLSRTSSNGWANHPNIFLLDFFLHTVCNILWMVFSFFTLFFTEEFTNNINTHITWANNSNVYLWTFFFSTTEPFLFFWDTFLFQETCYVGGVLRLSGFDASHWWVGEGWVWRLWEGGGRETARWNEWWCWSDNGEIVTVCREEVGWSKSCALNWIDSFLLDSLTMLPSSLVWLIDWSGYDGVVESWRLFEVVDVDRESIFAGSEHWSALI